MANLMRKRNRAKYVEQRERKIKRKRLSKLIDEKVKGKKYLRCVLPHVVPVWGRREELKTDSFI